MRRALTVGINDYPGAPLSGCRNDALDWRDRLLDRGAVTTTLLDEDATKANIFAVLREFVSASRFGDHIIWAQSGHGTWLPSRDGDEIDGRDEALCAYDYLDGGLIVDDEIHELFTARRYGVRVTIIPDTCHSGTASRLANIGDEKTRARFISPFDFLYGIDRLDAQRVVRARADVRPRNTTRTLLFAACAEEEVAYDAWFNGRPNGAFTRAALDALPEHRTTYGSWLASTRARLDFTKYPQKPQFYAAAWQKYLLF